MPHRFRWVLLFLLVLGTRLLAQNPNAFFYNDENGLPNNEVYCIQTDAKGFVWIGCEAGLFKFDGIKYIHYKNKNQQSQALTGLAVAASGRIYCYNFKGQIFYYENDSLHELPHEKRNFIYLTVDSKNTLYVAHEEGLEAYNESTKKWKQVWISDEKKTPSSLPNFCKMSRANAMNQVYFLTKYGLGFAQSEVVKQLDTLNLGNFTAGQFLLEYHQGRLYAFSKENNHLLEYNAGKISEVKCEALIEALRNKKINALRSLPDGYLWISTYNGIIQYNAHTCSVKTFFPELSFSDCLLDGTNSYWMSTLQSGILRIPNLNFEVINRDNSALKNDRLTAIACAENKVFFSNATGTVGEFDITNQQLNLFHTGNDADVQSFDYDAAEQTLFFNINNKLFKLTNGKLSEQEIPVFATKSLQKIGQNILSASSHGTYLNTELIDEHWARDIAFDPKQNLAILATNVGILQLEIATTGELIAKELYFKDIQFLSIAFDSLHQCFYALAFDGKIIQIDNQAPPREICKLQDDLQARTLKLHDNQLFISSNQGVHIFSLEQKSWRQLNSFTGLVSDNVQDLCFCNQLLFLATGKGLEKTPLGALNTPIPLAKIYLRNDSLLHHTVQLEQGEKLILTPEAVHYGTKGRFNFAYREANTDANWHIFPANMQHIEVADLPPGPFTIELKTIDYQGKSSANTLLISGVVHPKFWNTIWFNILLFLLISIALATVAFKIIQNIRKREQVKSALVKSQLTALKAQMNPHFMYNTLNSIQALILKHEIKDSNLYLGKFSQLMRKVLEVSELEEITLQEEVDMLQLYLSLEKLRFGSDFNYQVSIQNQIDVHQLMLPPLLLQPFVENAIKHGLLHKKGEKMLHIEMTLNAQQLHIAITDNGIGRKRSAEIKARQQVQQQSFSTAITQKRLDLLNKNSAQKIELHITDLLNDEMAIGTRVQLIIHQQ